MGDYQHKYTNHICRQNHIFNQSKTSLTYVGNGYNIALAIRA